MSSAFLFLINIHNKVFSEIINPLPAATMAESLQ